MELRIGCSASEGRCTGSTSGFLLRTPNQANKFIDKILPMKNGIIEFRQFREEAKTKTNIPVLYKSPKPTSFRELSESRDKNKLLSGKKSMVQDIAGIKSPSHFSNSGKKEGNLFAKLLTSRSPASIQKTLAFDETKNSSNDSGITFSAFKGISLKSENKNTENIKKVDDTDKGKGLQFKNFPHRRNNVNKASNLKVKSPSKLLTEGSLIGTNKKSFNPQTPKLLSKKTSSNPENIRYEQINHQISVRDSVIRSRCEQSLQFDMSPMIN